MTTPWSGVAVTVILMLRWPEILSNRPHFPHNCCSSSIAILMRSPLRFGLRWVFVWLWVVAAAPAVALAQDPGPRTRVIVRLRVAAAAEGRLSAPDRDAQRARIRDRANR